MRKFDLDDLSIVQAVVVHGGIAKAAQALHRVPSNVTTRIKQLESRLGVDLFVRRGRGLVPTEEGRLLTSYAERLLRLADEAGAAVRSGSPIGTLRIGSLESTAGSRLPHILARYNQTHPDVRIELITGPTGKLIGRLARHDIEAAFISEPFHAPDVIAEPVFQEELVLITARHIQSLSAITQMQTVTLIVFANGCSYRRLLEQWQSEHCSGAASVLEFASYPAIVACVAAGTGVAIVPKSVLAGLHSAHAVQTHDLPVRLAHNKTHLIWHEGQESLALQALRQVMAEVGAENCP